MARTEAAAGDSELLLEREAELERAAELLDRSSSGRGSTLILEGPAGIGKTQLLRSVRELGLERGMSALTARGGELERDFSYGIVRQLVEPALELAGRVGDDELFRGAAGPAAALLRPRDQAAAPPLPADLSFSILHALYWLVSNLSEQGPLVLTIDDAHWSDAPSLRFLDYLGGRVGEMQILLAVARRTAEAPADDELWARITTRPGVTVLRPAPLTESATGRLVRELLSSDADEAFIRACHRATIGNPFLLRELLADIRAEGIVPRREEASRVAGLAPEAVSRSVLLRLMRLPEEAGALAKATAILGDPADLRYVARLAALEDVQAAEALDALVRAQILRGTTQAEFVHPLVREAVYLDLGPGRRRLAHARAAQLLWEVGEPPERIAAQLLESDPASIEWRVDVLVEAAREALRRGAPSVATTYLRRALEEPPGAEVRVEVVRALGVAEALLGDPAGAEHLEEAMRAAPRGRPFVKAARGLAQTSVALGRFERAVETLKVATDHLGVDDRELKLQLEAEMATGGRFHPATYHATATRLKRVASGVHGDTPAERAVLAALAMQWTLDGERASEALELAERVLSGGLLSEQTSVSPSFYDAFCVPIFADSFDLADRIGEEALADARGRGSLTGLAVTLAFRSHIAYRRGAIPEAVADGHAAVEASGRAAYAAGFMALAFLTDALIERGEVEAAEEGLVRRGLAEADIPNDLMANFLLFSRGRLHLAAGRPDQAIADLREIGRRQEGWPGLSPAVLPYRSGLAFALLKRGETSEARLLVEEELVLAREWGSRRVTGNALRTLALVGGGDEGLGHLREAVSILEGSGANLDLARALVDLGAMLRRAGQPMAAREPLRRALDLAHRCGALALQDAATEELRIAGARPRTPALTGVDSLTPSERRVAQLAAKGLKNREIGQSLFLSVKTVSLHLTHAYQKLGISGRGELSVALADDPL